MDIMWYILLLFCADSRFLVKSSAVMRFYGGSRQLRKKACFHMSEVTIGEKPVKDVVIVKSGELLMNGGRFHNGLWLAGLACIAFIMVFSFAYRYRRTRFDSYKKVASA
jgi:hypothetical protein